MSEPSAAPEDYELFTPDGRVSASMNVCCAYCGKQQNRLTGISGSVQSEEAAERIRAMSCQIK